MVVQLRIILPSSIMRWKDTVRLHYTNINAMGSHEKRRGCCRVCCDILVDGMKRQLFDSAAER